MIKPMSTPSSDSWEAKLANGTLTEAEWELLREMVDAGEVETVEEAARLLDFRERELTRGETFYGF
jgi:hypothetical protein